MAKAVKDLLSVMTELPLMSFRRRYETSFKIWLEYKGKPLLGEGGAEILKHIQEYESLSRAAQKLGMSYRYVWGYIKSLESVLGDKVLETFRGGKTGGGGAKLTKLGVDVLNEYERMDRRLNEVLYDTKCLEVRGLKISARNRFKGKVIAVEKNGVTAKVKVQVTVPVVVTALISKEAVEDLKIKVGDMVEAIVKATEVMIAK
jgi:molybdate transport system regulatory protein